MSTYDDRHDELHWAVARGDTDRVRELIEDFADVQHRPGYGTFTNKTPLYLAATIADPVAQREITRALVDAEACDFGESFINWASPFEHAVALQKDVFLDVVKDTRAYRAFVERNERDLSEGLWRASQGGWVFSVQAAQTQGVDPNRPVDVKIGRRTEEQRPIEVASTPQVFDALLAAGANVPQEKKTQIRMLERAAENGRVPMLECLHSHGLTKHLPQANNPLCSAATSGHIDAVKWLLDHGSDPNGPTKLGKDKVKPLDQVLGARMTMDQKKEIAELLVDAGAEPRLSDKFKWRYAGEEDRAELQSHVRRHALGNIAKQNRIDEDLATPEQALAARQARYGRAM